MLRPGVLLAAGLATATVFLVLLATTVRPTHRPALRLWTRGTSLYVDTSESARVYLEYGPTRRYGLFSPSSSANRRHRFALADLTPGRRYYVRAVAHGKGRRLVSPGLLLNVPAGRRFRSLQAVGDHFELDRRPWFPLFTWGSCSSSYAAEADLGINAFMSSNCGDSPEQQARAALRVGGVVIPALDQARRALPTTVATYYADEPDLRQIPPAQLAGDWNAHADAHGIPTFLTLSHLAVSADGPGLALDEAYAHLADALGIDVYPIATTGDPGQIVEVARAQQALRALAGGKPTFQWIEATQPADDAGSTPTPAEVEAEAWLAIVNGARALGWWTYGGSPFSVDAADRRALREIGAAIDTFTPALEAPAAPVTLANAGVDLYATRRNGALTIFAVNTSPSSPTYEIFTLPGLDRRPVHIWNTGQNLAASTNAFADTLPPLGWRIYLIPPR
jgi:hypothetical protein